MVEQYLQEHEQHEEQERKQRLIAELIAEDLPQLLLQGEFARIKGALEADDSLN